MSTLINELNIDDSVASYTCEHCSVTFTKRKSLKKHVKKLHAKIDSKEKTGCFECDHCDKSFRKVKTLNLHIREDHNNEDDDHNEENESHEEKETTGGCFEEEETLGTGENTNVMEETESESLEEVDEPVLESQKAGETEGGSLGEDRSEEETLEVADKIAVESIEGGRQSEESIGYEQETAWKSIEEEFETIGQEEETVRESLERNVELNKDEEIYSDKSIEQGNCVKENEENEEDNQVNEDNEIEIEEMESEAIEVGDMENGDADETFNESAHDPNDDSLDGDIGHLLEVDMADSSSDEMILHNLDSSSDEIDISGEASIEHVDDGQLDQMAETREVKHSSRLTRKRTSQEMDQEEESNEKCVSRRKSSRRISTDFVGEVTTDDVVEIEEVNPTAIKALKGKQIDYKFPETLPESPDNIDELLNRSDYFQSKKSLIKSYYPSHKQYDVIDDDLPEGFRVWEQLRPNGKHVDKEFLTPDGKHVLRSKLAVLEYCKMILGTSEPSQRVKQSVKSKKNLKLSKKKVKKGLKVEHEDSEISVVKCLPKGTNLKFTFIPDYPSTEKQTAKKYSCSLCKKIFLTRAGFDTHVMKDHKNARPVLTSSGSPAPAAKKLICSYCKQMFPTRPDFMKHMEDDHPDGNITTTSPTVDAGSRKASRATIFKYPCTYCNKKFTDETKLEMHNKFEHRFACPNCTKTLSSKCKLLEHKKKDHSFKCIKCTASFEIRKSLEEHLIVEHYFKCEDCDIVFESRKSMKVHNDAAHTFRCGECAETFNTEERCSTHLKTTHQSCKTCEDEFSWAEADHSCYYTKNGVSPPSERVIEQNLYQGYFFTSK